MESPRQGTLQWARDELILALDLYFRVSPYRLSNDSPEVIELSTLLQSLPLVPVARRPPNFRNPAGVNFKLRNLQFIDTNGALGAEHYGANDKRIYDEFTNDRVRLRSVANAIRRAISDPASALPADAPAAPEPEEEEYPEGRILLRWHRTRERNTTKVQERKRQALEKNGKLACEACGFDFRAVYGDLGDGFIECHHTVPVSRLAPGQKTKVSDLALVCANCHRMLHRSGEVMTIGALRGLLENPVNPS